MEGRHNGGPPKYHPAQVSVALLKLGRTILPWRYLRVQDIALLTCHTSDAVVLRLDAIVRTCRAALSRNGFAYSPAGERAIHRLILKTLWMFSFTPVYD